MVPPAERFAPPSGPRRPPAVDSAAETVSPRTGCGPDAPLAADRGLPRASAWAVFADGADRPLQDLVGERDGNTGPRRPRPVRQGRGKFPTPYHAPQRTRTGCSTIYLKTRSRFGAGQLKSWLASMGPQAQRHPPFGVGDLSSRACRFQPVTPVARTLARLACERATGCGRRPKTIGNRVQLLPPLRGGLDPLDDRADGVRCRARPGHHP